MNRFILLLTFIMLTGCATALGTAIRTSNSVAATADKVHATIKAESSAEYDQCIAMATKPLALVCVDRVEAKYEPVWETYRRLRLVWLELNTMLRAALDGNVLPAASAILIAKLLQLAEELGHPVGDDK